MKDRFDRRLDPNVFHRIQERWDPPEVDMFASRLTRDQTRGRSPGCVQPGLDQPRREGICQPSPGTKWTESAAAESNTGPDSPCVEEPTMVPNTYGGFPNPQPSEGPDHSEAPRVCVRDDSTASRLAYLYLRRCYQDKAVLE